MAKAHWRHLKNGKRIWVRATGSKGPRKKSKLSRIPQADRDYIRGWAHTLRGMRHAAGHPELPSGRKWSPRHDRFLRGVR